MFAKCNLTQKMVERNGEERREDIERGWERETKGKNSENKNLREMGVVVRCHTTLDQHQPTPGLSFHCQYIPCTQIIQTVLSIQIHTCIVSTCVSSARYCQNVRSHQWLPSALRCCVCCCAVATTIGRNASNLSSTHRKDTPDTLLVNSESILLLFLHIMSCQIWNFLQ